MFDEVKYMENFSLMIFEIQNFLLITLVLKFFNNITANRKEIL